MSLATFQENPAGPRSLQALRAHLAANPDPSRPDLRVYFYHAHTHFSLEGDEGFETASTFKKQLQERFPSEGQYFFGRTHKQPVGPHPFGQFELVFTRQDYTDVLNYLVLNRPESVSIFIHPHTTDPVTDHTHRALWLGPPNTLVTRPLESFATKIKAQLAEGEDEAELLWKHHT